MNSVAAVWPLNTSNSRVMFLLLELQLHAMRFLFIQYNCL